MLNLMCTCNCDINFATAHNLNQLKNVMICQCRFVPLAVCISVQGPARWGGRPLFCDTEDFQALPLWATAAMTCQHRGVHALPGWVLEDKNTNFKS